ncbi:hypothetical protein J6590_062949, partial [Homalodisca vitripennis]
MTYRDELDMFGVQVPKINTVAYFTASCGANLPGVTEAAPTHYNGLISIQMLDCEG